MESEGNKSHRNDLLIGMVIGGLTVAVVALGVALLHKDKDVEKQAKEADDVSAVVMNDSSKNEQDGIIELVNRWCESLSSNNVSSLSDVYGERVRYYQSEYTKDQVVDTKRKALEKADGFVQNASDFRVEDGHDGSYRVYFSKNIVSGQKTNSYPSYLGVRKVGGEWKIIEESDLVTDRNLANKRLAKMEKLAENSRYGYYSELVKEGDGEFDLDEKNLYRYDKETHEIRYLLSSGDEKGTKLVSLHTGEKDVAILAMESITIISPTRIVISGCPDLLNEYSFLFDTESGKCVLIMADEGFSCVRRENGQDVIVAIERDYGDDGPELVEKIFDLDGRFLRYGKNLGPKFLD